MILKKITNNSKENFMKHKTKNSNQASEFGLVKSEPQYIKGLKYAAGIAAKHGADDGLAAEAATDIEARLDCLSRQGCSMAIEKAILKHVSDLKEIRYVCHCGVEIVQKLKP